MLMLIFCLSVFGTGIIRADAVPTPVELVFSAVQNTNSPVQSVTITNSGPNPFTITGASITGTHPSAFTLMNPPGGPIVLNVGGSTVFNVRFNPATPPNPLLSLQAILQVNTTDPVTPVVNVGLFGLNQQGLGGNLEPPLQSVVNTLGYSIDVGGTGLILGIDPAPIGDEVLMPLFQRAGPGLVTLTPVARYSPAELLPFGYYFPNGTPNPVLNQVDVLACSPNCDERAQMLNPPSLGGNTTFDPGTNEFGIYVDSASFGRRSYTEDALNTGPASHAVRVYPVNTRAGVPRPNTFLIAFEDAANGDYQDYVFLLENVTAGGHIPPTAVPDAATTTAGVPVTFSLTANDIDSNNNIDPATVNVTPPPIAEGSVTNNGDGTITFTPAVGFSGVSTFSYTVQDTTGLTSNAAAITVTVNTPPTAVDDSVATTAGVPVTFSLTANDTDPDNNIDPATVVVTPPPAAEGTVTNNGDGTITFDPAAGFGGVSTFSYTVQDTTGLTSNAATVTVTVNAPPTAIDDSAATTAGVPVTFSLTDNDTDPNNNIDPATVILTPPPIAEGVVASNGDGTITFTPAVGFSGVSVFGYTVQDTTGLTSNPATVTVTVSPAPAPPPGTPPGTDPSPPPVSGPGVLSLANIASPPFAIAGDMVMFLFTLTNTGGAALSNVSGSSPFDNNFTVIGAQSASAGVSVSGQVVNFSMPSLAPGQSIQVSVRAQIRDSVTAPLVANTACAQGDGVSQVCATAQVLGVVSLPATGETPWWRGLALRLMGMGLLLIPLTTAAFGVSRRRSRR